MVCKAYSFIEIYLLSLAEFNVRSATFTVATVHDIFYQSYQLVKTYRYFRDIPCPHNQDLISDGTKMIPETLISFHPLTRLITPEIFNNDFIVLSMTSMHFLSFPSFAQFEPYL
jgi:hypothetical protein